jgi:hypothetical protein
MGEVIPAAAVHAAPGKQAKAHDQSQGENDRETKNAQASFHEEINGKHTSLLSEEKEPFVVNGGTPARASLPRTPAGRVQFQENLPVGIDSNFPQGSVLEA